MRQVADGIVIVVGVGVMMISFRLFLSDNTLSMLCPRTRCLWHHFESSRVCFGRLEFHGAGTGVCRGSERGPATRRVDGRAVGVGCAATAPTRCQHALD